MSQPNNILNDLAMAAKIFDLARSYEDHGALAPTIRMTAQGLLITCAQAVAAHYQQCAIDTPAEIAAEPVEQAAEAEPAIVKTRARQTRKAQPEVTAPAQGPIVADVVEPDAALPPSEPEVAAPIEPPVADPVDPEPVAPDAFADQTPAQLREYLTTRVKAFMAVGRGADMRRALASVDAAFLREVPDGALATLAANVAAITAELAARGEDV